MVTPRVNRNVGFSSGPPTAGAVTRALCIAILAASLIGSLTQRLYGFGVQDLNFQVGSVLGLELWRLVTYPLVESSPWNLMISLLFLWLFGGWFESRWGERDFLRFFVVSSIGAALLAVPLNLLANFVLGGVFRDVGVAEGPGAALDAMLVAMALTNPDGNVLFGFVLPMRARTIIFVLLGIQLVLGIQTGSAAVSITLGGMAMGYLLVTGNWRPRRILGKLRASERRPSRRGLYVVPPRDRTLH